MSSVIKAVVFDMDGVLVDAKEWHYEALNRALNLFGFNINRYEHLTTFDGLPTRKKLEMMTMEHGLPLPLHSFVNTLKQKFTLELIHSRCRPTFQHEYALAELKRRGLKLGLASNSVRETITAMMNRSGLQKYFDVTLSNEDVTNAKPDPEIYLKAISALGVTSRQTLVVEDNDYGCEAARSAGATVLKVQGTDQVSFELIYAEVAQAIDMT